VRQAMPPQAGLADWEATLGFAKALGVDMHYDHPREIMEEISRLMPTFSGVNYDKLDRDGSIQWPCNDEAPDGTPTMHINEFVRGKGFFAVTEYVPTDERANRKFPLLLTTGRILSQYNVGAQTRRTENNQWHSEDIIELHPHDAEERGIKDGDWAGIKSRVGDTVLRAKVSDNMPAGVVYTTPELATVGATEDALKAEGRKLKIGKFMFMGNGRAKAVHQGEGFVKIITDKETDRVLGAAIIGPGAGDLIHEICVAMEFGASAEDIALTCHAHPTFSEAVREAALACGDGAIHA